MSKFKREFKNVVYNYTDAEAKVREATSNDPGGPSNTLLTELAEYTFHVQAYGLVMGMLWKRLNDHGKNWRHVYKSLVVLDFLIKSGSERVTVQCKENMFSIQTLKDFQYMDKEGKDQGSTVREKAKALVSLLKDEERLKEERRRAHLARERQIALGSNNTASGSPKTTSRVKFADTARSPTDGASAPPLDVGGSPVRVVQNVEQARPTDMSEEEMQLNLALQLSKQHAEEEERLKSQEDESLRAAIALSKQDAGDEETSLHDDDDDEPVANGGGNLLLDFSETGIADPWTQTTALPAEPPPSYDTLVDPFAGTSDPFASTSATSDPFAPTSTTSDPFASASMTSDPFVSTSSTAGDVWGSGPVGGAWNNSSVSPQPSTATPWTMDAGASSSIPLGINQPNTSLSANPFDLSTLTSDLPPFGNNSQTKPQARIEDQFLGTDFGNLVDLDSLTIPPPILNNPNPFGTGTPPANPFDSTKPAPPSLNQIGNPGFTAPELLPPPLVPTGGSPLLGGSPVFTHVPRSQANPFS